ncbi:MAG: hypothetical protein KDE51_26495, partial [Anaerolineales bacterium]|nr:hypothetical protein [Anaerolineales bacterium]
PFYGSCIFLFFHESIFLTRKKSRQTLQSLAAIDLSQLSDAEFTSFKSIPHLQIAVNFVEENL